MFDYLHPNTARDVLVQALLAAPMFGTRWRWNVQRALLLERRRNGKRVPANLMRMRAEDLLAAAFPAALACPETLPGGPIEVPDDHPIVRQTVEDCLTEAMDVDGFLEVLRGLRDGTIERRAIDTPEPSAFARGILSSQPYTFLDDAPLEERRTQAVMTRRILDVKTADDLGALDADAVARVREEAWPGPPTPRRSTRRCCGWATSPPTRPRPGRTGSTTLAAARPRGAGGRPLVRGGGLARPQGGPARPAGGAGARVVEPGSPDDALLRELEAEGIGAARAHRRPGAWCDRRLLARIHRYTLDRLRREIEPVTAAQFLRFLACWQHVDPRHAATARAGWRRSSRSSPASRRRPRRGRRASCPRACAATSASGSTSSRLRARWRGRACGARRSRRCAARRSRSCRATSSTSGRRWRRRRRGPIPAPPRSEVLDVLTARGAVFVQEIARATRLPPARSRRAWARWWRAGRVTCDSFGGLRWLLVPAWRRRSAGLSSGRWSLVPRTPPAAAAAASPHAEFVARALLRRTGVVFRRTLTRERIPVPWRDLARACRTLEARGEIRGGRFVAGFDGEQYALPEAVTLLREVRRQGARPLGSTPLSVSAADPLNFQGILTPDDRVPASAGYEVAVG